MKWILVIVILMLGCSHSPGYYRSPLDTCDDAPSCVVSAIIEGIINSKPVSKKCSEMSGTKREKCNAKVDTISKLIMKAQKN
jgi:hypothetical protein